MPIVRVRLASVVLAVVAAAWPSWSWAQQPGDGATGAGTTGAFSTAAGQLPLLRAGIEAAPAVKAGSSLAPRFEPAMPTRRPKPLPVLYASFGALQALDAATTFRALDRGATEANPALAGFASNRGAMVAVKAASFASTVYLSERLWKKNRVAAVVTMVCVNSAYAAIVAHNYRAGSRLR
jgi:hypothetical protein